ncbi:MAG TPA: lactate dehydrogenase [Verrucomicrobiae bacterium]|nr:lactate dehydrogenase [Verrucomicrobiae bacterium]
MKISVVGIGKVGSTLAFTLSQRDCVHEMVLVGRSREDTLGDALDIAHAQSFIEVPTRVIAGTLADTENSDILVMCASIPTPPQMADRALLGPGNVRLMRELLPPLVEHSPRAVVVMVSNPVDALTYYAIEITGFPAERVIGAGTLIDSARLRHELSLEVGIHSSDLRAYILGEHGGSQFAAMSCATAGGEAIDATPERRALIKRVVRAGLEIFNYKGHTNYGIALAATAIVEAIALDTKHTMPVSVAVDGFLGVTDVCLSLPAVIGRGGVERILHPRLNEAETEAFRASAAAVRRQIEQARSAD